MCHLQAYKALFFKIVNIFCIFFSINNIMIIFSKQTPIITLRKESHREFVSCDFRTSRNIHKITYLLLCVVDYVTLFDYYYLFYVLILALYCFIRFIFVCLYHPTRDRNTYIYFICDVIQHRRITTTSYLVIYHTVTSAHTQTHTQ